MLTLSAGFTAARNMPTDGPNLVVRLSTRVDRPAGLRKSEAFLAKGQSLPDGYGAYMGVNLDVANIAVPTGVPVISLPAALSYLDDGDIVRISPRQKHVGALFRKSSPHNHFLLTERCNHYCLMCSQPPKDIDDGWIARDIIAAISLVDRGAVEIGLTGGEPTLLGDDLFCIIETAKAYLPSTAIHMLSNGRRFADLSFAQRYAAIDHHDIMVGIPIYSDLSTIHDYVVQADGAFDETIRGILNLKRVRQKIEIRIVVHQQTYKRLPHLAEFLARNLTFVDHVTFMGLEMTGFTRANLDVLWIDPVDYRSELYKAVSILADTSSYTVCHISTRMAT